MLCLTGVSWQPRPLLRLRGVPGVRAPGLQGAWGSSPPRSPCPTLLPFVVLPWFAWGRLSWAAAAGGVQDARGVGCTGCRGVGVRCVCMCSPPEPGHQQGERCGRAAQKAISSKRCHSGVMSLPRGRPAAGHPGAFAARPLSQGNAEFGANCKTSGSTSPACACSAAFACWVSARACGAPSLRAAWWGRASCLRGVTARGRRGLAGRSSVFKCQGVCAQPEVWL